MLCEYGCGQEAKFQLKNGKLCCSKFCQSCPVIKIKNGNGNRGKESKRKGTKLSEESKLKISNKLKGRVFSEETIKNMSKAQINRNMKGSKNPMFGKKHKIESIEKMKGERKDFSPWNKNKKGLQSHSLEERERSRQYMLNGHAKYMNTFPRPPVKEETKNKHRQHMLNGGAIKALKGVKNPSKPEVMLRNIVKELYPKAKFQFGVFNYSIDVALVNEKIAIEYDGYYHFNCQENIDYHKFRQEKIEKEGWKFIRYNIFQKFPTIDEIKQDIWRITNI
jgi:very-short-patch-repair endonuclease